MSDSFNSQRAHILMVDDNPANLLALRTIIDELGENIIEALSGEEAIEQIQRHAFAVILLDVIMPGIDGFETARAIRRNERSHNTPIIFLTAGDMDRVDIEKGYSLGAVDFVVKPLMRVAIQSKVRGFVELFKEKQRTQREADQLRLLIDGTSEYAIFMLDAEGRVLTWNTGAERLKGYKPNEIVGRHFSKFYPRDAIDRHWPEHELKVAKAEGRFEDEGWRIRKDGSRFWANVIITALYDDTGNLQGFSKITRDMTERKIAEENHRRLIEESTARQFAEESARVVQDQRERLQITLASIGDAVISTDAHGNVDFLNPVAEQLVGWTNEEASARELTQVFKIVNESNRQPVENPALRALEEGVVVGLANHTVLISKNGMEYPIDDSAAPIRNSDGSVVGSVLVFRDISEKKRSQEMLRESESRFRGLMEQAPISIQILNPAGQTIRVNKAWEDLWGITLDQLTDYNVLTDPQLDAKGILPFIQRAFAGESVVIPAIEYNPNETIPSQSRHKAPQRWISAVAYPLKDLHGSILEVVLIHTDITARHEAEQALMLAHEDLEHRVIERTTELARANEFMNALLENVQTGIVACDANGVLTLFNSVTRDMHGLEDVFVPAERWAERYHMYHPDGKVPMTTEDVPLYKALQGERVRDAEMVIAPPGLSPRTVISSGQAFYDAHGEKLGAVVSMQDITLRKQSEMDLKRIHDELELRVEERTAELARANESLRQSDRRKDEFLATLAHELRNPLAPIYNALQILKLPSIDLHRIQQSTDMMERQVSHLIRLVDDLLDVSRVMRGKVELRKQQVELSSIIDTAVETAQSHIESKGHRVQKVIPQEALLLHADPVRLSQVVANLLINAAKYTDRNGQILISARGENGQGLIAVRDNGIGIASDLLPHVFELFVQADNATTRTQGGLGIGLTLVKNLVEIQGGIVEAHSDGLGKGSEFIVRLPLINTGAEEAKPKIGQDPKNLGQVLRGHRLIVVDDNKDAATSLAMLLRLKGHEVKTANNGPEAIEMAISFRPDLIFLDIGMPGMDGYEVARRLRQQPGLDAIVLAALTGWGQQEDRRRTAEVGFDYHLVKPLNQSELMSIVSKLSRHVP